MSSSDERERLKREFQDPAYREAYANSFLDTYIAAQVQALRQQRGWTQSELAERCGTRQPGIARLENSNHAKASLDFLRRVSAAFDTRLKVSFETYGSLLDDAEAFSRSALERPVF